jgi:hypothetical protein
MKKIFLFIGLVLTTGTYAQWSIDVESGLVFQSYNDVRIPNKTGTLFSFNNDFELQGPVIPLRITAGFSFSEKDHVFALFAPLGVNYEGEAPFDIAFQQVQFTEGQTIEGYYKFNSYRLTYRRDLLVNGKWTLGIGFTAKIRDARVKLTAGEVSDKKDDVGFVPLLHLHAAYQLNGWTACITGDGLAGGPGRAFDVFAGARAPLTDFLDVKAGYRLLEGGADIDAVYNFTLINFALVGVIFEF